MMGITHAVLGVAAASIALGTADPVVLGVSAIASQLPDIDTTKSWVGVVFYPVAHWLEERYEHRTITHSWLASAVLGGIAIAAILYAGIPWKIAAALPLGHFVACLSDTFTKAGVALFYPNPVRCVAGSNPRARIATGSTAEYFVLFCAMGLLAFSLYINTAGGLTDELARQFFQNSSNAATFFNRNSDRAVLVDVVGIHTGTNARVDSRFTVIDTLGNELLAEDNTGNLYRIGDSTNAQIKPSKVRVSLGDRITVKADSYEISNLSVAAVVEQLPPLSYVTGSLTLDAPEPFTIDPLTFPTVTVTGQLQSAKPATIARLIGQEWIITGQIVVKERV
ncbi:MAG: metal-dependent hydrolase [Desertifilum sp.]|nr:metal-dependent hydrolase [Desertifilum sp.]